MSIDHVLVLISALIVIVGASLYIKDTLRGKTKPNLVSWSMWALAPLIGTAAAISIGADFWATSRIFLAGFLPLLIVLASFFNPKSYWKLTVFDFFCGISSGLAIVIWLVLGAAQIAILFAVVADGFAVLPTVRKAWISPETETGLTYVAGFVATLIVIPSIPIWNIENSAFQIYLLVANAVLIFSVYRKRFI